MALFAAFPAQASPPDNATRTVVIHNENDPDSSALAKFYAEQRKIPADQVVGIRAPLQEEITRAEFETTIALPLRRLFVERGWWILRDPLNPDSTISASRLRFAAIMRGVPLKVAATPGPWPGDKASGPPDIATHNEASVDAELTILGLGERPISGALNNPYFRSFTRIAETPMPELLLCARLDAPTVAIARRMLIDSIAAEKTGLRGFTYIDSRGFKGTPGYQEGDDWLVDVATEARRRGLPVILDNGPGLFPETYPMRHAALYFGWYTEHVSGPFLRTGFRFVPGAVAVHIHSYSATTLRDPRRHWSGPLLAAGAAATVGNVYEPFLTLTPHLNILHERLQAGFTFAEAAYMAQRGLSWMTTIIGDPLYRPFPPLEGRTAPANDAWSAYRTGAQTWFGEGRPAGEAALRASARRLRSGIIYEGLGLLLLTADDRKAAIDAFGQARRFYLDAGDVLRVGVHEISALRSLNQEDAARTLSKRLLDAHPTDPAAEVIRLVTPPPAGAMKSE